MHFDPFKWYVNDIRDYMGVQSIFGLFLQLNWKETTFVTSWKNIHLYVKTSFNIPLNNLSQVRKTSFNIPLNNLSQVRSKSNSHI